MGEESKIFNMEKDVYTIESIGKNHPRSCVNGYYSFNSAYATLMRKVYLWMTLALTLTGVTAYEVANSRSITQLIMANAWIAYGLAILEITLVVVITGRLRNLSLFSATSLFFLYSLVNGVTLSSIFLIYSLSSIAQVFFISSIIFGLMSIYGYTTKKTLSGWKNYLFMELIGLTIASIINLFIESTTLDFIICCAGVIVFVGLTAYDTKKTEMLLLECGEVTEGTQKLALVSALSLYLDFINLFLYILRIFGSKK